MIALLSDAWALLLRVLESAPLGLWTLVLACCTSALLTQRAKFWLPIRWSKASRLLLTQGIAFWSALAVTWALWPTRPGLIAGCCIGIASPTLYAVTVRLIGLRWPAIRDLLSQDVRP